MATPARARQRGGASSSRQIRPSTHHSISRHTAEPASRRLTFEREDVLIRTQEPLAPGDLLDQGGHDRFPIQASAMQFFDTVQNLGYMQGLAGPAGRMRAACRDISAFSPSPGAPRHPLPEGEGLTPTWCTGGE